MKRAELIEKLQNGKVVVTFTKKDGTERVMKCTLHDSLIGIPLTEGGSVRKPNDDVLAVWDLEKNGWRSFRLDSIKNVV